MFWKGESSWGIETLGAEYVIVLVRDDIIMQRLYISCRRCYLTTTVQIEHRVYSPQYEDILVRRHLPYNRAVRANKPQVTSAEQARDYSAGSVLQ